MQILTEKYFEKYKKSLWDLEKYLENFKKTSKDLDFSYLLESSSVYSSNIEWNSLDLNSFMNLKMQNKSSKDKKEIDALFEAYSFAIKNPLNEKNFLETHKISSKTILIKQKRWVYRDEKVGVFWKNWLVYLAIEPEKVENEMKKLFSDIKILLEKDLEIKEIFYYASLIHLVFVCIHPFADWNGRTARLLEKWFLAEKLGKDFWKLETEKYYKENREKYYKNLNLWVNYYEIDYSKSNNFLQMLINSLKK